MNGPTLVDRVRDAQDTELTRLGSEKALLAATDAALDTEPVLATVAGTEQRLGETFEDWEARVTTAEPREVFSAAAEQAATHAQELRADIDAEPTAADGVAVEEDTDTVIDAVAGQLVGQSLVFDGLLLQAINFFVNEADGNRADTLRDVRSAVNNRIDDGAELLDQLCQTDEDWTSAHDAAVEVIEAAYAEYVTTLDGLGIDPKPVC